MKGRQIVVLQREVMNDISDLSQYGKERAANGSFIPTFFTSRLKREKCRPAPQSNDPPPKKKTEAHQIIKELLSPHISCHGPHIGDTRSPVLETSLNS